MFTYLSLENEIEKIYVQLEAESHARQLVENLEVAYSGRLPYDVPTSTILVSNLKRL